MGSTLIKVDDVIPGWIKITAMFFRAARAGATVQKQDRDTGWIAALFDVQRMNGTDLQLVGTVRFDGWVQSQHRMLTAAMCRSVCVTLPDHSHPDADVWFSRCRPPYGKAVPVFSRFRSCLNRLPAIRRFGVLLQLKLQTDPDQPKSCSARSRSTINSAAVW